MFDLNGKKIWVAGETGMVGRAVLRALNKYECEILSASHDVLDLTNQAQTFEWLEAHKPDVVIMTAGRVGGIGANASDKAGFLYENLALAQNVIHGAYQAQVEKLLYLGSSCIYPKESAQPIKEEALLTGALEPTNEGYALAKIVGVKLCEYYNKQYGCNFISAMPCNLYGPYDNFNGQTSHVIPALMMKMHQAKTNGAEQVTLWGTGDPLREFLHVDDLARGCVHLLEHYNEAQTINIGSNEEVSIKGLVMMIAEVVGYEGKINFDTDNPDGAMRKLLDNSKVDVIGWKKSISLENGLKKTYEWFLTNV